MPILNFRHKGLERFFVAGNASGGQAKHAKRLRLILGRLSVATAPRDMSLPGMRLHRLAGDRPDTWSVSVDGNWRIPFKFSGRDVRDVNYEDYH